MKREDLEKLGLSKEQIDAVMAENGKDVEAQKAKTTAAETERDGLKKQIDDANKQIESFKAMDIEGVKKSADEYKTKFEQAAVDAQKQIADLKFSHALEAALTGAKAKDSVAVRAHLNTDLLKLAEDGSISGLKEQLEKLQSERDYLFESDQPAPRIVAGGQNKTVTEDSFMAALRKGAGLSTEN